MPQLYIDDARRCIWERSSEAAKAVAARPRQLTHLQCVGSVLRQQREGAMAFIYDQAGRRMLDDASGEYLIFDRILPEDATYVLRFVSGEQTIPLRSRLTWDRSNPPHAVWQIENFGKDLMGQETVKLDPDARKRTSDRIKEALLSYSAGRGPEFQGAIVRNAD